MLYDYIIENYKEAEPIFFSDLKIEDITKSALNQQLKKLCDIIIIDGTPCELVTDSVILSRIVDSTVVVTAHQVTKKEAIDICFFLNIK